jgi:hypothetical protein
MYSNKVRSVSHVIVEPVDHPYSDLSQAHRCNTKINCLFVVLEVNSRISTTLEQVFNSIK